MQKSAINPWDWSKNFGYSQAQHIEGGRRQLFCSGQTSVDGEGRPQHPGDMRRQILLSLHNLDTVLKAADMGFTHIVRLNVYTTDVDEALKHFDVLAARLAAVKNAPSMTLFEVRRFALPELLFEMEATAID